MIGPNLPTPKHNNIMPSKAETKSIKTEIRDLKKKLTNLRKTTIREIAKDRKASREAIRNIEKNEAYLNRYEREVNQRIAILEGRLSA